MAIIDWFSRYVISWRIDDTLENTFVLDCADEALSFAIPEIMNSDQGSNFTSPKFVSKFLDKGAKFSMDHRGRAYDNIFIERFWRSLKYEDVYPNEYDSPRAARIGISAYIEKYNNYRLHQALGNRTPASVHFKH